MEFPKDRGVPYFGGPYSKDPTISGTVLGSPIFGNSHMGLVELKDTLLSAVDIRGPTI